MRVEGRVAPQGASDAAALRAAYRAEQDRLLAQRIPVTVVIYLTLVGVAVAVEWVLHPQQHRMAALVYAAHTSASAIWLAVAAFRPRRLPIGWVAVGMACSWSAILVTYTMFVSGNPERAASAQICLLYGLFFMLPWAWPQQLAVSALTLVWVLGASLLTMPGAQPGFHEQLAYAVVVVTTGLVTSVGGVVYLERYRFAGFLRQELLARASREKQEEAEIAAALLQVSETLSMHVNEPGLLAHLTRVAVEALGCDWGSTFALDQQRGVYTLGGLFGEPPGVREEIEVAEFTAENLPLVRVLSPGTLVEMPDTAEQSLVPPELLVRWGVASQLVAPIAQRGRVVGALCLAHRTRRGGFTVREQRLARGIVHATALALANSALIDDLRAANTLRSEFVSTMSHELRTPLNVILGFAEMAQDTAIDSAERHRLLEGIADAGRDLLRLIEDTLAMGRIEAGREAIALEPVAARALWERLERECARLARKPAVALEWLSFADDGVVLVTDVRKLVVVVRNLVHNALKFTEAGWVRVQLAVDGAQAVLTVTDTGIGIAPASHQTIFEMFRQGDGSDTRRYGGTGLGLHIVRRFVEQLGGTIGVDSVPDVGSRFTVSLPRQPVPATASDAA